jgi:hypothetical protein
MKGATAHVQSDSTKPIFYGTNLPSAFSGCYVTIFLRPSPTASERSTEWALTPYIHI